MIMTMGEVLIDFIGKGELSKCERFEKCFGGAPANVARGIAALGEKVGMLGMVSNDGFGKYLHGTLKKNGVDVGGIVTGKDRNTRLAFVSVKEDGEREFTFYSDMCADEGYGPEHIDENYLKKAEILHFGSIGMMSHNGESATLKAAEIVKSVGGRISYDPNLRPMLWSSESEMLKKVSIGLKLADILKVDLDEFEKITGERDPKKGIDQLPEMELVCITLGNDGCYYYNGGELKHHKGYKIQAIDCTGAGDAFTAGLLYSSVNKKGIDDCIDFANRVGATSTKKRFPDIETVRRTITG